MKKLLLLCVIAGTFVTAQAQVVTITAGTSGSALSPFNNGRANCVYEVIYEQSRINQAGTITRFAFEKNSGTDQTPLTNTVIYLKTTTATTFTTGTLDTTGYQRVWAGAFSNSGTSGYQEVVLNQPFAYANTDNLSVLVVRNNGNVVATGAALWSYDFQGTNVCRRNTTGDPISSSTPLTAYDVLMNLRLTFGGATATRATTGLLTDVYPNPTASECRMQLPTNQPAVLRVIDLLGRTIRPAAALNVATTGTTQVALSELPAGIYLLDVVQGAAHMRQRVVKE